MKIAFVGNLPAAAVFPEEMIREKYRKGSHPAPWIQGLLPSLAQSSGFQLRVILVQRAILRPCLVERDGVEYQGIPYNLPERLNIRLLHYPKSLFFRSALKEYGPDLVHAFGMETGCATMALRSGFPVSCFVQGISEKCHPFYPPRRLGEVAAEGWCEARAVERIRWFIAETEFARNWVHEKNPDAEVAVIPHPLRDEFLSKGNPEFNKRIVTVGGFDGRKGMDTIIKAFAKTEDLKAELCLVGSGAQDAELRELARTLGVADRVEFPGVLGTDGVIEELNKASVFVIASRMDTSPNVLTEAHAAGLPVIGTRTGGIPEMITEGEDGFTVDVDDAEGMAPLMDRLLADPGLCKRMGAAGREKVRCLNAPESVAATTLKFFQGVEAELRQGGA